MLKLIELQPITPDSRRIEFDLINNNDIIGKVDIILFSDFFKQHDNDPTVINEVSIQIKQQYRNQGLGTQAMLCLLKRIQDIPLLYPLWSIVHESNYASISIHNKLPYIKKKSFIDYVNGYPEVFICYQLTK